MNRELKRTANYELVPAGAGVLRRKDLGLSKKAKRRVAAQVKECYWNARRLILADCLPGTPRYVEGVAVMNIAPIAFDHAWVELEDGTIVDPTLVDAGYRYFGAYSYDWDACHDHEYEYPGVGPFWGVRYGPWGVYRELDYQKAHIRAELVAGWPLVMIMATRRQWETAIMLVCQEDGIDFDVDLAAKVETFLGTGTLDDAKGVQVRLKKGGS
jgi:hypothetical protein